MGVQNVSTDCTITGGNTGVGQCFNDFKFVKGIIFVPAGKNYSTTSIQAFKTAIEADILADQASARAYPLQNIHTPTDNSEAPVEQTFPDGSKAIVRNGNYDWSFQWTIGGLCLSIAMQKANGKNRAFFLITDDGKLWGSQGSATDTIKGIVPNLAYTPPFVLNTGAAVTVYATRVVFTPDQLNKYAYFLDFGNDGGLPYLTGLSGLQDVNITQGAARSGGVLKVKAITSCGTVDMYDVYSTQLAAVGAWVAINKATGNNITITSVAADANIKGWTVTLDTSDPDYVATAGGVLVGLQGPTELAALLVVGYESNKLAQ